MAGRISLAESAVGDLQGIRDWYASQSAPEVGERLIREILAGLGDGEVTVETHSRRLTVPVAGGSSVLIEALRRLDAAHVAVLDVGMRRPTLDDVFLGLTGHSTELDQAPEPATSGAQT